MDKHYWVILERKRELLEIAAELHKAGMVTDEFAVSAAFALDEINEELAGGGFESGR